MQTFLRNSVIFLIAAGFVVIMSLAARQLDRPRILGVNEVPVAFWSWRLQTPSADDINGAIRATNFRTLFQRAGQFDVSNGAVARVGSVTGSLPTCVDIHLVYNGTRKFLREWEHLDEHAVAQSIVDTYVADLNLARGAQVTVKGIQLDIDVPERLLPRYARLLREVRPLLPARTSLSVTGLPTWMNSNDLPEMLDAVDFWAPQCYGLTIPDNLEKDTPISSASQVGRVIDQVRRLRKPFYAGVSAYGYVVLYSKNGGLLELRGDIDPGIAAKSPDLDLVDGRVFNERDENEGELRYIYRAHRSTVLAGLVIEETETLLFDLPSTSSLRASARAVRENAGQDLLGICLFRLPTSGDKTAITLEEINAAITDSVTNVSTDITAISDKAGLTTVVAKNTGSARSFVGEAVQIDLDVPQGAIRGVASIGSFSRYQTLCRVTGLSTPTPCSQARATVVRLGASSWAPGDKLSVVLITKTMLPSPVKAMISTHVDDGRIDSRMVEFEVKEN